MVNFAAAQKNLRKCRLEPMSFVMKVKASLLEGLGKDGEAVIAYEKAIGLCTDNSVRTWLSDKVQQIQKSTPAR